jgi:hypothetical protein
MSDETSPRARTKENVMAHLNGSTSSVRVLTTLLAAAPVALALLAVGLYRGAASDLTPLALVLPLLSMGALEAVLEHESSERRSLPPSGARRRIDAGHGLHALRTA